MVARSSRLCVHHNPNRAPGGRRGRRGRPRSRPTPQRSARLVFAERAAGRACGRRARPRSTRGGAGRGAAPIPPAPVRRLQRLAMKRGAVRLRDAQPGAARRGPPGRARARRPSGPPRFLVRVDEFPLAGAYEESARARRRLRPLPLDPRRRRRALPDRRERRGVARDYLDPSATDEPAAVRPRAGDARSGCAGTACLRAARLRPPHARRRAPPSVRAGRARRREPGATCSTAGPPGWPRPGSTRACSPRRSTASRRASTTCSRGATTSSAADPKASRCSASTGPRCGAARRSTCPPTRPSTAARATSRPPRSAPIAARVGAADPGGAALVVGGGRRLVRPRAPGAAAGRPRRPWDELLAA